MSICLIKINYAHAEKKIEITYASYNIADGIITQDVKITNNTNEQSMPLKLIFKATNEPFDPSGNILKKGRSLIESTWPAFDGGIKHHTLEVDKPFSKLKDGVYYLTAIVLECYDTSGEDDCRMVDYYDFENPITIDKKKASTYKLSDSSDQSKTPHNNLQASYDTPKSNTDTSKTNEPNQQQSGAQQYPSDTVQASTKQEPSDNGTTVSKGVKLVGLGLGSFPQ
jgi:hypothetical protein